MIQHINIWANGIIVAIIIATIIEMLLPNGNNKKYIKTILGLYVLFAIIGPVIDNFGGGKYNFNLILNEFKKKQDYQAFSENSIGANSNIEQIYKQKLEEDVKTKLKAKGYDVAITALSVNLINGENYGTINQINIKINKKLENTRINQIEKVEISISKEEKSSEVLDTEKEEIKKYISEEYGMETSKVNILWKEEKC